MNRRGHAALEVRGLNAFYGKSQVVFNASFTVQAGETVTLLGRNGAGKTSTLLAIAGSGLLSVHAAAVRLGPEDVSRLTVFKRVRKGLSLVPSGSRAFADLTVHENLAIAQRSSPENGSWTFDRVYATFPALRDLKRAKGGQLSGGERQMLAVARALIGNPLVLMLDEPSEGLAPLIVKQLGSMIRDLNEQGLAVLLTEQNHRLALDLATRAHFIEKGSIVWSGESSAAREQDVIERFLAV